MNGSAPMMAAEALASIESACTLAFIFLRSRSTRERLPSASERLPPACGLDLDDDAEEAGFRAGHRLDHAQRGFRNGQADLLRFDDAAELGLHRFLRFVGDQPDAVIERQARFDRADDDVERVGEFVQKLP